MLEKLYNLVYGKEEYDKTKFESRFEEIEKILPKLKIEKLEDFESLEKSIYKIKDLLRLKSSNLNKAIKSQSSLTNKRVFALIEELDRLKYDFLKHAFASIKGQKFESQESREEPEEENFQEQPREELDTTLLSTSNYSVILNNGKVPHILVSFVEDVDLSVIRDISSKFFEEYKPQGTTILIEKNRVLIIPRFEEDNLLELPRVQSDINEVYSKLKPEEKPHEDYIEVSEKVDPLKHSHKKKEDSLDSLLGESQSKHPSFTPKPKPKEDTTEPEVIQGEPIKFEKKEEKPIKEEKFTVERSAPGIQSSNIEVYRDDSIKVSLKENSKIFGELEISTLDDTPLINLNESELSYVTLFSKVFSSVLFDTLQSHGTNIVWDFSSSILRIVPRYQDDKVDFDWEKQEDKDEFLEQIKEKLLSEMHKELSTQQQGQPSEPKSSPQEQKSEEKSSNLGSKEEKLKYLVDSIRRIP